MSKYPNPFQYDTRLNLRHAFETAGILLPPGWSLAADGYSFTVDHVPTPSEILAFRAWLRDAMPRVYATLNSAVRFTEPNGSWRLCHIVRVPKRSLRS